ncbi:probable G-protein coupled receptor No9 [Gigantopelta aegis]|uniref:probable G-protein coupled receptor No9 n=1 Tax=Gigantopelta aegis TaxID=1735272 RepID=UPI001B88D4AA|nr:probable G-protein coupled receptor No9 [Gigantopelta aegis]
MAELTRLENATYTSFSEDFPKNGSLDMILFGKIFAGIDLFLAPWIILGNTLILIAVCFENKLHTIPNAFIASLAVADLLVGLVTIPLYVVFYLKLPNVEKNKYLCLVRSSTALYSCGSSLLNLLLISFDRYLTVIYPLRYHALMTPKRARDALIVLWVFSTVVSFVPLTGWNAWKDGSVCDAFAVLAREHMYFWVYFLILGCLTFTTILYSRIFYVAHSQRKKIQASSKLNAAATRRREREFKSAKVMSLISFLFILFWVPYLICSTLKFVKSLAWDVVEVSKSFALCLSLSNSMINALVYSLLQKDFRKVFRNFLFSRFGCCKVCKTTDISSVSILEDFSTTQLSLMKSPSVFQVVKIV